MLRKEFIKVCFLSGIASASGIATSGAETLPSDLQEALLRAGVTQRSARLNRGVLRIQAEVADFGAFAKHGGGLGDGKVRVVKNTLSFARQGQLMELNIVA